MNTDLKDFIYYRKNFLTKEYCKEVIRQIENGNWQSHHWYNQRTDEIFDFSYGPKALKNSQGYIDLPLDIEQTITSITDNLHPIIFEYIKDLNLEWFTGWEGYTEIKLLQYSKSQEMKTHCDHVRDIFEGERKGIPIFSIIGLLNEDYEGGKLIMFDREIKLNAGDLVIFPSNFLYPHKISPVTDGVRYSYVSWGW